ncbi:MAG: alpha/beta hydrolase, partial [Coleofasciculus sp. S288]|nr:alpha/beta hydrolase [Coleofasciculus sp. S288]
MSRYLGRSRRWISGAIAFLSVFYCSARADAAESVVLKYRFLRETVSVRELRTFADTGQLSRKLQVYLKLAGREPAQLRSALTKEVKVNSVFLYRVLNTPVGEGMLDQVSQIVHTPSNRANRESLRSAFVSSALSDGQITLIEV